MPVNFKRTCGWSWHAVQRKHTTCWDLAFCKQNNEKHNHGRRQGQGPATKERQLISDSVVTVLQIGIFHNYIVESRGTLRKETKNNLLPPSPPAVVKWPLLSCQDKKFFDFLAKLKTSKQRLTHIHKSPHPCFHNWKFTRIVTMDELQISGCHHGPIFGLTIKWAAEKTELKWESCLVSRCTVISLHQPLTCAWIWPASSTHDFQGIGF